MPATASTPREMDTITCHWQWALDAAARALDADRYVLPAAEIGAGLKAVTAERHRTAELLDRVAALRGIEPPPWLSDGPVTPHMLGLPPGTKACLFDLDGVLADSGVLHAAAWADTLDPLILDIAHSTGRHFVPFDREADYRLYFDGRTRLEGLHLFLDGRGLRIPEGRVAGLTRKKGELLEQGLARRHVATLAGARRYLQAAGRAHIGRAVITASATALEMLELAEIAHLVEFHVDADTISANRLRSRPSPDVLLAACSALEADPEQAVALTQSGEGVAAGRNAGLEVVGVALGERAERLLAFGATRVVPSLAALLDPRLAARPI
jgi:beta-phosphoglucomutase-like phosphatase (HAD superfamily)